MGTYICIPSADLGPNDYVPSPLGSHYINVDDEPNDGDTTILSTVVGREVFSVDYSAIPDSDIVTQVLLRSVQKQSTAGNNTYHAGFIIGGADTFGPDHALGTGSAFVQNDDDFSAFFASKADLVAAQLVHEQKSQAIGLPRPHLTELVVLVSTQSTRLIGIHNGSRVRLP